MKKKRVVVLHAQAPFIRGGAELMVENLTLHLRQRGFEAELIAMPFKWYPNNVLLDSFLMWRMADLTESNGQKIDLLIPLKVPTYLAQHPNKVIWLMHQQRTAYDLKNNVELAGLNSSRDGAATIQKITEMDTLAISEARAVYAISKTVKCRLREFNGIDSTPLYHPPALVGSYFCEEYGDYILSVGRLDPIKRVDLLIRALSFCDRRVRAVIAGKGPEGEKLKRLAEKLGVADRVDFLGFVPDSEIVKLYAGALAVCFPPIDEDYGYITLEAFLSKKPVLTCVDSGGVLEFAERDKSAFVLECNPEKMGACIDRLYRNKALAKDMGEAGYQRVKDISWDNVIDELTRTIR